MNSKKYKEIFNVFFILVWRNVQTKCKSYMSKYTVWVKKFDHLLTTVVELVLLRKLRPLMLQS
jgi:hypothetical protein